VAVPPAPVRVPSQRPLAPNVASVTTVANDKGDNEIIPRAVHRSPSICLRAEENPGKPQLGDRLMKGQYDQSLPEMGSLNLIELIKKSQLEGSIFVLEVEKIA
jgi:hypothetical protein